MSKSKNELKDLKTPPSTKTQQAKCSPDSAAKIFQQEDEEDDDDLIISPSQNLNFLNQYFSPKENDETLMFLDENEKLAEMERRKKKNQKKKRKRKEKKSLALHEE